MPIEQTWPKVGNDQSKAPKGKKQIWEWDPKESNLLKNTESGRYWGRFKVAGKNKWYNHETNSRSIAIIKHAVVRKEVLELRANKVSVAMGRATMGMLADEEVKSIESNAAIVGKTKAAYIGAIDYVRSTWPGFDKLSPRKITAPEIQKWRDTAARTGANINRTDDGTSPAHINKCLDMLRNILTRAVRNGQISKNPLKEEKLKLPVSSKKVKLPDVEDMDRLFRLMDLRALRGGNGGESANFCQFIAFTGARLSEITGIDEDDGTRVSEPANWGDVDMARGVIHLRGTKTPAADRWVPIFEDTRELLRRMQAERTADPEANKDPKGNLFSIQSAKAALANACEVLGLPKLTHHDLRDHFATSCIEGGTPIPTVAAWLGHNDGGALLLKVYNHHRGSHSMRAAKNVFLRGRPTNVGAARLAATLAELLNEEIALNGPLSEGATKIIAASKAAQVTLPPPENPDVNEAIAASMNSTLVNLDSGS